jgi:ubiquinone/menaquinone biosynthesis C-methylase UbiE
MVSKRQGSGLIAVIVIAAVSARGVGEAGAPSFRSGATSSEPRYSWRRQHDPHGTGKFYMGREIAQVMGHSAAAWLERRERSNQEAPDQLIEALGLREGDVVADIGAGTGFITRLLARAVGPTGRVQAVDIQPQMLRLLKRRLEAEQIRNVVTVLGTAYDPKLPPHSVDLVLMVDVYHEFAFPFEMMRAILPALRTGGRVVLVEYRKEDAGLPIKRVHTMTEAEVVNEMAAVGLRHRGTVETLPWQHIVIFEQPSPQTRPASRPATGP